MNSSDRVDTGCCTSTEKAVNSTVTPTIVADGDLTSEIEVNGSDETGQMMASLKHMNASLIKIVAVVLPLMGCVAYLTLWERKAIGFDKAELWIKRINEAVLAEREACAEAAVDAVAFNGGAVQTEAYVRQTILARNEK